jgi:hypothetical protein
MLSVDSHWSFLLCFSFSSPFFLELLLWLSLSSVVMGCCSIRCLTKSSIRTNSRYDDTTCNLNLVQEDGGNGSREVQFIAYGAFINFNRLSPLS